MPTTSLVKRDAKGRMCYRLREVARYLDENAEALIGDMEVLIASGEGLSFAFVLTDELVAPSVKVGHEYMVINRPKN